MLKILKVEPDHGMVDYIATYGPVVYAFCYRSLNDEQFAQHTAQEVLAQGWLGLSAGSKADERLRLLALAYHCCMHVSLQQRPATSNNCEPADVQRLLSALPAETRCAFILQACCALTPEEIAVVTGLSVDQIKAHLIRARRALAATLAAATLAAAASAAPRLGTPSEIVSASLYQ